MALNKRPLSASMLDNYISAERVTSVEDEYGDLSASATVVTAFWGNVKEDRSESSYENGKPRLSRKIEITARDRDVEDLDLEDELILGNTTDRFVIVDFYESDWRWGRTIIAEYTI